jgi:hypothetical protein
LTNNASVNAGILSPSSVQPTDCAGSPTAPSSALPTPQPNTLGGVTVQQGNPNATVGGVSAGSQ